MDIVEKLPTVEAQMTNNLKGNLFLKHCKYMWYKKRYESQDLQRTPDFLPFHQHCIELLEQNSICYFKKSSQDLLQQKQKSCAWKKLQVKKHINLVLYNEWFKKKM